MMLDLKIKIEGNTFEGNHKNIFYYGLRNKDFGTWCGYIIIKPNHPYYFDYYDYYENARSFFNCHGGVTYVNKETIDISTSCKNVRLDDIIIGFDCAHHTDILPSLPLSHNNNNSYKNKKFAIEECKKMIDQLDKKYPDYMEKFNNILRKLNS